MTEALSPSTEPQVAATSRPWASHLAEVVTAVAAPLTTLVEIAGRMSRGGRQRSRAQVLAAAERADAAERARAFGRLLSVRLD